MFITIVVIHMILKKQFILASNSTSRKKQRATEETEQIK